MLVPRRLPLEAHLSRPWRIHDIAKDFRVEDVWALPTPGGEHDFAALLALMTSYRPAQGSRAVAALFALRWSLGRFLGLDHPDTGLGRRVASLRARLPVDLVDGPDDAEWPAPEDSPFEPVYRTHDEAALELANDTVHGVMHLGWVESGGGNYRGQLAVLVKPNGVKGRLYLAAIKPFRYALVYPAMLRALEGRWRASARRVDVPDDARELSLLPRIDYADAFELDTASHPDWTAERWARAVLEEAPATTRAQLRAGWTALGLKLATGPGRAVLGWQLRRYTPETVLLAADSRVGMPGELLFALRPDGRLLFATFIQHETNATRPVWSAIEGTHVRMVQRLLDRAGGGALGAELRESAAAG